MCICQRNSWFKALTEREAIKEVFSATPCSIEIAQKQRGRGSGGRQRREVMGRNIIRREESLWRHTELYTTGSQPASPLEAAH